MADDFNTSPPTAGGATFRALDDGARLWPAGVTAYATTLGTPDVCQEVTPTTGLPVQQQTGHTFVVGDGGGSLTVDGTFWQATQPVSVASVPSHDVTNAGTFAVQVSSSALPTGASTAARQDTGNTSLASIDGKITAVNTGAVIVSSSALPTGASTSAKQDTGNTSLASIDGKITAVNTGAVVVASSALPTGASTAAKQPALGTAGTASADVITVQGIASMTALKVDGSAVTQPVSGPLTDAQLRATPVPVSGTVTATVASNKVEDTAHATGDTGSFVLGVRTDTMLTNLTSDDGDYSPIAVDVYGRIGTRDNRPGNSAGSASDIGSLILGIRNDSSANLTTSNLNYSLISVDSAGRVVVTENGGSLTVDAPVATPVFVRLSDGAAAISTLPVSLATVPSHAVTNAGTFAVQVDGDALTALQLIDDTVATLGTTTYTEATTKGLTIGAVRRDADTTLVGTTNEIGPLQMNAAGQLKVEAFSGETLPVSLASVPSHAVTNAGTFAVQVDGAALTSLQLIDDTVFTDDAAFTPATSKVLGIGMQADETSTDSVDEGDIGCPRMTLDRQQIVADYAHASAGATPYHLVTAASTNATVVKNSAGTLFSVSICNTNASVRFLKFVDKATAPTAGSETILHTIACQGSNGTNVVSFPKGLRFTAGISFFAVTGLADTVSTGVGADMTFDLTYK